MTTLIITRGLQGSGKTTNARAWVAADPQHRARINRDDLRAMAHQSFFAAQTGTDPGTERVITAMRDAAITAALHRGIDVVSDDTNLPARTARDLRRLAQLAGADFEVWDLTQVPLQECLRRNAARTGREHIPEDAIRQMWTRYIKPLNGNPMPMPADPPGDDLEDPVPYLAPPGAPDAVIVDIDGTTALMGSRHPFDETKVHQDRPNPAVVRAVQAFAASGHHIIFASGRTAACRQATEKWLAEHTAVPYAALHMRAVGDTRKDAIVKREIFDQHIRQQYNVVCVLDDRDQVVRMWRSLGLTVMQVAEGKF